MSVTLGPLKNSNLLEHRLPSEEYNALARIDDCKLEPLKHREAHSSLLNLIAGHGLSDKFSIHLVHKHFDVPQDQVMVYEKVKGGKTPDFVVMTPRDPKKVPGPLRGLYFKTTPDNKMQAYEYTTEADVDLSAHEDFVQAYATLANGLGVGHIFALGAEGIATVDTPMAEFEMGPYSSTVLVEADSLPGLEQVDSSPTDWVPDSTASASAKPQEKALAGSGVAGGTIFPEIQGLVTTHCIAGRNGSHNYHGNSAATGKADEGVATIRCAVDCAQNHSHTDKSASAAAGPLAGTGQVTTHCLAGRSGNHNYHGQSANPDIAKAPLSGAGKVGGTLHPEVQGLITTHCIAGRSGSHNYHGNSAAGSGNFSVETRQSMAGMSNRVGQGEVMVHPGIRVGDLPVMKDSVIHDVLDRAVQAIEAY